MNKGTVKRLLKEMTGRYKLALVFVFILIMISTLAGVSGSFLIQRLIDDYIPPLLTQDTPVYTDLILALAVMAGVYLLGVIATFLYGRIMISVSQGVQKKIRDSMFAHMQRLPIRYFDTHTHGDIMSHYTNDIDTLREFFSQSLPQLLSSIFTIVMVSSVMLSLNLPLCAIILVFVGITILVSKKLSTLAAKYFFKQQQSVGQLNGYIKEMINGQKVIKVFCHEDAVTHEFDRRNNQLQEYAKKANRFVNIIMPIVMNLGALQYVAIAFVGGAMALGDIGGVTLGAIAAFMSLSKTFTAPIAQISSQVNAVTMALAGSQRIFTLMDQPIEEDEGYVTLVNAINQDGVLTETDNRTGMWAWKHPHGDGSISYTELKGDVSLDGVDFGYVTDKTVLRDVSLYAKPGQKIAFVGATGAGKTTITNLINRFYDIPNGKIRYDGININKIKKADLRRSLGVVLQDTHLFTGTVADNIRYGNPAATDEQIKQAAILSGADDFITRLPNGYDTMLSGDGSNLSGGQRQLLAIARAAVADPPVMILDEATSSIDTRTETIVQRGMDSLMQDRTVFVIAHRLSTVKNAKAIMVLENGQIIERGDHDQLISEKGKYHQLYTGSFAD